MPITKQYQTYYGIHLTHYEEVWGGKTYKELLVKEFPSEYLSSASHSSSTDTTFIYPTLWKNKYYIDGVCEGHVSIFNTNSTTTYYCSRYTVELLKSPDVPNSETVLGSYSNTLSTASEIYPEDYLTLPVFIPVQKALIEEDERLLFRFYFYNNSATSQNIGDCFVACYNDSSVIDMQIKIPYAYQG